MSFFVSVVLLKFHGITLLDTFEMKRQNKVISDTKVPSVGKDNRRRPQNKRNTSGYEQALGS